MPPGFFHLTSELQHCYALGNVDDSLGAISFALKPNRNRRTSAKRDPFSRARVASPDHVEVAVSSSHIN